MSSATVPKHSVSTRSVPTHSRTPSRTTAEMMRAIHKDFAACRSLMDDIQSRLWLLEHRASVYPSQHGGWQPQDTPYQPAQRQISIHELAGDSYAKRKDFLDLPQRLSGFRFDVDSLTELQTTSPAPAIQDVPALSPTTERREPLPSPGDRTPRARPQYSIFPAHNTQTRIFQVQKPHSRGLSVQSVQSVLPSNTPRPHPRPRAKTSDTPRARPHPRRKTWKTSNPATDNIVEQIVDVNLKARPAPPYIQSPPQPRSRATSGGESSLGDEITALPAMPVKVVEEEVVVAVPQRRGSKGLGFRGLLGRRGSVLWRGQ